MYTLYYNNVYILTSTEKNVDFWKQHFIKRGFAPLDFRTVKK